MLDKQIPDCTIYPLDTATTVSVIGKIIELTDSSSTLDSIANEKMRKLEFLIEREKDMKKY